MYIYIYSYVVWLVLINSQQTFFLLLLLTKFCQTTTTRNPFDTKRFQIRIMICRTHNITLCVPLPTNSTLVKTLT